jgi:SM-20-related protein
MRITGPNQLYEEIISALSENNYALGEGLFGETVLAGLHAELHRQINLRNLKNAAIGNRANSIKNEAIRSDKIKWIDNHPENESERAFIQKINDLSAYLNRTCYTGIRDCEFHYACFEKGSFYKRHIDQFRNDESRKFSVVTYLNKNWSVEDGGELVLYIENQPIKIQPIWGRTVIFNSELIEHEVLKSERDRLSVTGWLK